jgi:regulator of protease activity HflC (stomatin/prohibitin superfamily)
VPRGFRGIQKEVLGPGAYNINPLAYTVVKVPTVTRSVDWSAEENQPEQTTSFNPFLVVSYDGFEMTVEVRCQYRIKPEDAPYVIQRIGSVEQLELNAIHPQIDGIFRAQVSKSPAISYQQNRADEQKAAEQAVRDDLKSYRVEVISVMITNILLPPELMRTTQQKNLAEQERSMYDAQREAQIRRKEYETSKAEADQQPRIIEAQAGITVSKHQAQQAIEKANGDAAAIKPLAEATAKQTTQVGNAEAEVIRTKGEAQAKAYTDQVSALTAKGVTMVEVVKSIAAANLKITPDILVSGGQGSDNNGLINVLLAQMIDRKQSELPAESI